MAKKTRVILVDEEGDVCPQQVTVKLSQISKIKWLAEIEGESITITFDPQKFPFNDSSWTKGRKKAISVTGKNLSKVGTYDYEAKGWVRRGRPGRNPKLIVEGGRPKAKKR